MEHAPTGPFMFETLNARFLHTHAESSWAGYRCRMVKHARLASALAALSICAFPLTAKQDQVKPSSPPASAPATQPSTQLADGVAKTLHPFEDVAVILDRANPLESRVEVKGMTCL